MRQTLPACCAREAIDQVAAVPTRRVMKSRRVIGPSPPNVCHRSGSNRQTGSPQRCPLYPHVWTAPSWQGLFSRLQHWSVRPCVRPFSAAHRPLAIMPSADQVPINSAHSTNAWGEVGCPDRRIDRLCITCCLPFPTFTSRRMSARSRLRRQCDRFLVTLALRHHRPRHPRDLIGKSDGGDFGRPARQ